MAKAIMASVTYDRSIHGKCNYGRSIMANVTELSLEVPWLIYNIMF